MLHAQIILYYHVTKQFLACLNWLVTGFQFQNVFWKNISCCQFWWKTCTKRCTSNYVISHFKRLSFLYFAVGQVLLISGNDLENRKMPCKQKYWIKNMGIKIPILILFRFCLLCRLCPVAVEAVSCFNYINSCRWF